MSLGPGTTTALVEELRKNNKLSDGHPPWWAPPTLEQLADPDPWKRTPPLPKGASEKDVVQPYVSEVIRQLGRSPTTLRMHDTHNRVSYLGRKPDVCIYPADSSSSCWYIVAVGEVKGRRGDLEEFDDGEAGKLISFLQDLLRLRPDREWATGFLTDGHLIQFFRVDVTRDRALVSISAVKCTQVFRLPRPPNGSRSGGDWLHALLMQSPNSLGCHFMDLDVGGHRLELLRYLGEGSSGVVWQGKHNKDENIVVKIFRTGKIEEFRCERRNLKKVEHIAGVTKLIDSDSDVCVLLLSPVGQPFSLHRREGAHLVSAEHFLQLVDILKATHAAGLVHRDLSWNNFFLTAHGKVRFYWSPRQSGTLFSSSDRQAHQVFLNDWASAVELNTEAMFCGALQYAADEILRAGARKKVVARRSHDTEMLVKLLFACMHPEHYRAAFPRLQVDQPQAWMDSIACWHKVRQLELWGKLFEAAEKCDDGAEASYDGLKELIARNLPSVWAAP